MEKISLDLRHRKMILEMCKTMFPKLKKIKIEKGFACEDNFFINFDTRKIISSSEGSYYSKGEHFCIHWFEFCVFFLQKEILLQAIKEQNNSVIYKINNHNWLVDNLHKRWEIRELYKGTETTHPIIDLYECFSILEIAQKE